MFLILWMAVPVVALWNLLFTATSSELDSLVLTLALLCFIKEIVLVPLHKKGFRLSQRMEALQPKIKELEEKYADDPDQLSSAKAKVIVDAGGIALTPLFLALSVFLCNLLLVVATILVFWTPESFAGYTIIDSIFSTADNGYVLLLNRANLFEQLLSQLGQNPLNWGVFAAAELFVLLFRRFAAERTINFKPGAFQVSTLVCLFLPSGVWLSRMIYFCVAWPFGFLFEAWKRRLEGVEPSA